MHRRFVIIIWIAIVLFVIAAPTICLGQAIPSLTKNNVKTVIVSSSKPIERQLVTENTIYEIRNTINLEGKTIFVPPHCEIIFKRGGVISNGTVVGDKTLIIGQLTGVLDGVSIQGSFINKKISSGIFKHHPQLSSLINLVGGDGIIDLNSDIEHDGSAIPLLKSITIDGIGHTINIQSEGIKSGFLFEINEADSIKLINIIVDGGLPKDAFSSGRLKNQDNFKWLINAKNCDYIKIQNCKFKNLFYQMARCPDYPYNLDTPNLLSKRKENKGRFIQNNMYNIAHYAMLSFIYCKKVELDGNIFENVNSEEGISFLADNAFVPPVKSNDDYLFVASHNKFISKAEFSLTLNRFVPVNSSISSWIGVAYGKCEIDNNEFGACEGSQLNAFCSNSIIKDNVFYDSKNGSVDLNEGGFLGFVPENVIVSGNRAYNTLYFIQTSAGVNVSIVDNEFDCSGIPEGYGSEINMFAFCNRNTNDYSAPLDMFHPINNMTIARNTSINAIMFLCEWNYGDLKGEKVGLVVDSNVVVNRTTYMHEYRDGTKRMGMKSERPAIYLCSFKDVRITNNVIKGTGCPYVNYGAIQKKTPTYINVIQPSKDSYLKDVLIANNKFECEFADVVLLTHMTPAAKLSKKRKNRNGIGIGRIKTVQNNFETTSQIK